MSSRLDPRPRSSGSLAPGPAPALPSRVRELPILVLYPHARCDCRCAMCDIWQLTSRAWLDPARVAAEAPAWRELGVRRVVLSGGEPLRHPDLWALVRPLLAEGMGVTLLTTGLLLAREAEAVARHVDDVIVSLDGPRPVHDAIRRVPRAFDRLAAGLAALARVGPEVALSARCTVQRANAMHLRETVAAARALGLGRISFLPVDVTSTAFNRPGGWSADRAAELGLRAEELPAFQRELDALVAEHAADFASGFIAESPAKLARIHATFAARLGLGSLPPVRCNAPWVSAVVEADGTLRPCFFHRPIGRWAGQPLAAVLNGPEAVAFREGLDVATDETCRRCVCSLDWRPAAGPEGPGEAGEAGGGGVL